MGWDGNRIAFGDDERRWMKSVSSLPKFLKAGLAMVSSEDLRNDDAHFIWNVCLVSEWKGESWWISIREIQWRRRRMDTIFCATVQLNPSIHPIQP
jgi:hypothetical protein